jgi:adenosylmethionine-8-amino-7-oxononanoate aminotransferase
VITRALAGGGLQVRRLLGEASTSPRPEAGFVIARCAQALFGGLQISPPLVITEEQLGEMATGLRAGLDAVAETT